MIARGKARKLSRLTNRGKTGAELNNVGIILGYGDVWRLAGLN